MESTEIIEPHYHLEELHEITEHPEEEALDANITIPETLEEVDANSTSGGESSEKEGKEERKEEKKEDSSPDSAEELKEESITESPSSTVKAQEEVTPVTPPSLEV